MSAEMYDAQGQGQVPFAQPAVDVLPTPASRKSKQAEPEPVAPPATEVTATWQPPSAAPEYPTADASWPPPAPDSTWSAPAANPTWGAPEAGSPSAPMPPAADGPSPVPDIVPEADDAPKKFFGMQVRRGKKKTEEPEPVAGWPTDVAVPVIAEAIQQPGAAYPAAPVIADAPAFGQPPVASEGLYAAMDVPAEQAPTQAPIQAPVYADASEVAPAIVPEPSDEQTSSNEPAPDDELRALRALLEASEGQRLAAESRAEQAMVYARQAQAQLQEAEASAKTKIDAAEAKARTAANDVQDWQIRHREAEATIAELSQSVGGAEKRLAELKAERDDLMAALEDATKPEAVETI
jgi:hypothetical protein